MFELALDLIAIAAVLTLTYRPTRRRVERQAPIAPVPPSPTVAPQPVVPDPWDLPMEPQPPAPLPTVAPPAPIRLLPPAAEPLNPIERTWAETSEVAAALQRLANESGLPVAELAALPTIVVAPPTRKLSNTERLRKECTAAGIRWRNTGPKGKHLTVSEMRAALAAIA